MRLHLIGVNHFDPFHRGLLTAWLTGLSDETGAAPTFVANELTDEAITAILLQRQGFMNDARQDWPVLVGKPLATLGASLGFDGDTHWPIYGRDRTLWLGHIADVSKFAEFRLARCHQFVDPEGAPTDGNGFLAKLSEGARKNGQPAGRGNERDMELAGRILDAIIASKGAWGICVLGDNHTRPFDDTTVTLLRETNNHCQVVSVRHLAAGGKFEDE